MSGGECQKGFLLASEHYEFSTQLGMCFFVWLPLLETNLQECPQKEQAQPSSALQYMSHVLFNISTGSAQLLQPGRDLGDLRLCWFWFGLFCLVWFGGLVG